MAPPDALVLQGVPPVPAELAARVERYASFRSAVLRAWHPARRELLLVTRFGEASQVHRVRGPLEARTQLTFSAQPIHAGIHWLADDGLLYLQDEGGDERFQLYRQERSGERARLTDGTGRTTDPVVSRSGALVAYGSTHRNGADVDVWVSSTKAPTTPRLLVELTGGGWAPLAFSPDERRLVIGNFVSVSEARLAVVELDSGRLEPLSPPPAGRVEAWGKRARFASDGRSVFATTDGGGEFLQLVRVELTSGRRTPVHRPLPYDVEHFDVSDDGRRLVLATNEAGRSVVRVVDAATGVAAPLAGQPSGVVGDLHLHRFGQELGVTLSSNRLGTDVYVYGFAARRWQRWTESETGGYDTSAWSEGETVAWQSFDGRRISGVLHRPPPRFAGRRPVLIELHGGPEAQARPGAIGRLNYLVQERGVAVLFPNVRGSTGFGRTFHRLDDGLLREDAHKDVGALLDWIATRDELDASRVVVAGGSYGGYLTLATAVRETARLRGAIAVVGMSNLVTFLENTAGYRKDLRRVEYGDERDPAVRAFLERTAPLRLAAAIKAPLFVLQGANDPRVPASEAEQMVATVRAQGTPVWYFLAKDEGHGFAKRRNADYAFWTQLLFLEETLLSGASPPATQRPT